MDRYRRRGSYQLSSDFSETPRVELSRTVKELSPIPKENYSANLLTFGDGKSIDDKLTSTPRWESRGNRNHNYDNNVSISDHMLMRKSPSSPSSSSSSYLSHLNMSKMNETNYSSGRSPWGVSISPQMRPRAMGIQSVQTVAGPLLASTRYNIDPKTYADVRSPGLTSRLTKYATEANTKLIYQSQYRAGQFPKINLNSNPMPIVNIKSGCGNVTPVKVKIAQPETVFTSPDRKKISNIMYQKDKYGKKSSSNVQSYREIPLKRHASTDEISEFIKKQRTDGTYNIEISSFEEEKNYYEEEITQKRARDESSRSEDDISIDNTSRRPFKKTKKPSCYDVLSSLSSSSNMNCGVKRKADVSRCDTPEMGKPYKTLKNSVRESLSPNVIIDITKLNESLNKSIENKSEDNSHVKLSPTISRKYLPENDNQSQSNIEIDQDTKQLSKESLDNEKKKDDVPVNFSEKLFMKEEEPDNVDKFKSLIEERGDVKGKFSAGTDEIIKEDIVVMRQTSMKAKLQSMFDAISGKVSSKIDSSVVIRADKSDIPTPSSDVSPITTLNSQTSTTTVNSSPILTSVVSPIIGKTKNPLAPTKHVTFELPSSSQSSSAPSLSSSFSSTESNNSQQMTKETSLPVVGKTLATPTQQPSTLSSSVPSLNISVTTISSSKLAAPVGSTTTTSATTTGSFSLTSFGNNSGTTQGFSLPPATTTSLKEIPSTTSSSAPSTTQTVSFSIQKATTGFNSQQNNSTNLFSSEINKPSMFNPPTSVNSAPQQSQFSFGTASTLPKSTESLVSTPASSSLATPVVSSNDVLNEFLVFGASTTTTTTTTTSSFATVPSTATSANNFTPAPSITTAAPPPSFSFGTSSTGVSKGFSFGAQNTTPSVTSTPVSFASSPSVSLKSGFQAVTPATSTPGFGITLPASSASSTPSFGIGTTTSTAGFGISSPSFTMPAVTSASLFSTPTTTSSTTTTTTTTNTQQTPSIFQTNTQKNLPSLFSATPTTSSTNIFSTNSTLPSFGAAPITTTATTTTNLFNTQTNSTPSNSIFGITGNSVDQAKQQPPPAFGATSTSFGTNTNNNFGNNLFTSSSATNNVFGKPSSDAKLSAFGDVNSSGGTFKPTNPSPSVFGSGTGLLNGSGNNAASFGATNTTAASFFQGTTTNTGFTNKNPTTLTSSGFGTPAQQQPPPPFPGSNTSFSGLGTTPTNTNSTTAPPPVFGSQNFSTTNASNNATSPFSFGSTQTATSQPQGQQQSGIFGFSSSSGSNTDKPASGTSSLFQFGGAPTAQSGQFNFSTNTPALPGTPSFPAGAPPAFGAGTGASGAGSSGGMFSIGSGSTAPRSRPARSGRRQR